MAAHVALSFTPPVPPSAVIVCVAAPMLMIFSRVIAERLALATVWQVRRRCVHSLTYNVNNVSVQRSFLYLSLKVITVAKKASKSDRSDPKKNKSLAIRTVLKSMPNAKASEVVTAVKKEFGQDVKQSMVYMVKTKGNMAADGRAKRTRSTRNGNAALSSAAQWVEAIKVARQLLKVTGSVANATALLKAVDG